MKLFNKRNSTMMWYEIGFYLFCIRFKIKKKKTEGSVCASEGFKYLANFIRCQKYKYMVKHWNRTNDHNGAWVQSSKLFTPFISMHCRRDKGWSEDSRLSENERKWGHNRTMQALWSASKHLNNSTLNVCFEYRWLVMKATDIKQIIRCITFSLTVTNE